MIDLHRHLEGSVRSETILDRTDDISSYLTAINRDGDITQFFAIFRRLQELYDYPDADIRITRQVIADAATEGVQYLEIRFNPLHILASRDIALEDVCQRIFDAGNRAAIDFGLSVEFILTFTRHRPLHELEKLSSLSYSANVNGFCGVDIAGIETACKLRDIMPLVSPWVQRTGNLTVHCCERFPNAEIIDAINDFGAVRIGHGIHICDVPGAIEVAQRNNVVFEVCPVSNLRLQSWPISRPYPLRSLMKNGLKIVLGTDDPSIFNTTLPEQYRLASSLASLTEDEILSIYTESAKSAFGSVPRSVICPLG